MKHTVNIRINDETVLKACQRKLPRRLLDWLFGGFQQVYLISPGKTIESIDVKEVSHDE